MTTKTSKILVIEDDPSILLGLRLNLESEGYSVATVPDGQLGLDMTRSSDWDLVVLDLMLPGRNGYEILSDMRARKDRTPVLILSARNAETDTIMGLDFGADDYVTKPFSVGELMARVRAALRRHGSQGNEAPLRFADLEIRAGRRQVLRDDAEIELTATEFDVLMALVEAHGRVLSRRQIMDRVWGSEHHGTARTVDNFLAQLRAKLERDPSQSRHLVTVRGVGYRFEAG